MIKKNVRIQLFKDGEMTSERMVSQGPEFYNGPKEKHDGPMRIEFTIDERSDAESAIKYLQQLVLDLPIKTVKGERGRKAAEVNNDDIFNENKVEMVYDTIDNCSDQDSMIKQLREMGFVFVESDFLKHFIIPKEYEIKNRHLETYQWLVRRTREAKDPKNDKYDPQVLIGIQIFGKRSEKIVLYNYGEFKQSIKVKVPEKAISAKKTNLIKYPSYMNEEERFKWGTEHRLLFNNPAKKPSKFYMRWVKDVQVGDELKISKEELSKRLDA